MPLARKGSRLIKVSGHTYRWAVSPTTGFMDIVIELEGRPGQRAEIQTDYCDVWSNFPDPPATDRHIITPRLVERLIDSAQALGWNPFHGSGAVQLRLDDGALRFLHPPHE